MQQVAEYPNNQTQQQQYPVQQQQLPVQQQQYPQQYAQQQPQQANPSFNNTSTVINMAQSQDPEQVKQHEATTFYAWHLAFFLIFFFVGLFFQLYFLWLISILIGIIAFFQYLEAH